MKLTRIAIAGGIFGAAAIVGGLIAAATSGGSGDDRAVPVFSQDRLAALDTTDRSALPRVEGIEAIDDLLNGAPVHLALSTDVATAWLAEMTDGSICVVARDTGGFAATCGDMQQVAAGAVVLRVQNRADDPTLFVGIAPNDLRGASVGGNSAVVDNNVWIATGSPSDDTYTVSSDVARVTIDMNADTPLQSLPGPDNG